MQTIKQLRNIGSCTPHGIYVQGKHSAVQSYKVILTRSESGYKPCNWPDIPLKDEERVYMQEVWIARIECKRRSRSPYNY